MFRLVISRLWASWPVLTDMEAKVLLYCSLFNKDIFANANHSAKTELTLPNLGKQE